MNRGNQRGAALILALLLVFVLTVMGISLMFLSTSETWGSLNYRMMTQARYGAEGGLNAAANYLANVYVPPGTNPADPLAAYIYTSTSPVTFAGTPVVLSSSNVAPNYPVAGVQTAFAAATAGNVADGNTIVKYNVAAMLVSMRQIKVFGSTLPQTIQTWQLTANGRIKGVQNSTVEVSTLLERETSPTFNYAAFGTSSGCGALKFAGGAYTNSYDSSVGAATQNFGGDIGANGNLNENGSGTTIYGTMYTPATGVGNCSNGGVTAWTDSGNATVTGGVVKLGQPIDYPTPTVPPPDPLAPNITTTYVAGSLGECILTPCSFMNIDLSGSKTITFCPGTYNINSITITGQAQVLVNAIPPCPVGGSGPVVLNVTGAGTNNPVSLTGGGLVNQSLIAENFQIVYAGTGEVDMEGGSLASGVVYAPNAYVKLTGGSDWYGSLIGRIIDDQGGTAIHYDRELQKTLYTVGNWLLNSFNWSKF